jgi:hypothetical protein
VHFAVDGADLFLGGLEAGVFTEVALAVGLDLVLDETGALGLEGLKLLCEDAVVAGSDVDGYDV